MAEYIERDELLKDLCTVSAPTPSESWIVEKCIERVNEQPTADVVPKKYYFDQQKADESLNKLLDNAKSEVAREIFEEIEKYAEPTVFGGSIVHLCRIAELKKKYTEKKE